MERKQSVYYLIFVLLIIQVYSGPLAPGAWTAAALACAAKCAPLVPGTPQYLACFSACWLATGPGLSLLCFS